MLKFGFCANGVFQAELSGHENRIQTVCSEGRAMKDGGKCGPCSPAPYSLRVLYTVHTEKAG